MLTGAVILLSGIVIGYSIHLWVIPFYPTVNAINKAVDKTLSKILSKKAQIIDMSEIDLGNE